MSEPKFEGVHIKRPYADGQRINEIKPLCGADRFATYVPLAEGESLPGLLSFEAYCLKCVGIQRDEDKDLHTDESGFAPLKSQPCPKGVKGESQKLS